MVELENEELEVEELTEKTEEQKDEAAPEAEFNAESVEEQKEEKAPEAEFNAESVEEQKEEEAPEVKSVEESKEDSGEVKEETESPESEKSGKKPAIDADLISVIDSDSLLVALDDDKHGYLTHGVHIGLKYRTSDMRPFIYKIRPDKLCVFEVSKIDRRIKVAAKLISRFNPKDVLVVSNRGYGKYPIKKFAESTGCVAITKRFVSGTLTNPNIETYAEPKLLLITDPSADLQAIKEAAETGIPTIAICDTNTRFKNLDFVIPGNNKGKNSLALIYLLIAREIARIKGKEFTATFEGFVSHAEPQPYLLKMQELQRRSAMRRRGKPRR